MLTQLLSVAATILGFWSTWLLGRKHHLGWMAGIICCCLWIVVDVRVGVWAGIAQAGVTTALSVRAWIAWRARPEPAGGTAA